MMDGDNKIKQKFYFYDTNALIFLKDKVFEDDNNFAISSRTIEEIENIKINSKSEDLKYQARCISRMLDDNQDKYEVYIVTQDCIDEIRKKRLEETNDNIIVASCFLYDLNHDDIDVVFVSGDLNCKIIADKIWGLNVEGVYNDMEDYKGWIEIQDDIKMAKFYENKLNEYELINGQYIVFKDKDGEVVDKYRWSDNEFIKTQRKSLKSLLFGDIKPKDVYQEFAIDSLINNDFTIITGKAGSGKSLLALAYAIWAIQTTGKYTKLKMIFNPCSVRGSSEMGFYSGNKIEKSIQKIGNILIGKFGDEYAINTLIGQDKLELIPLSDSRGIEIKDGEILYVTEAQNMSIDMCKLIIQRAAEGAKIILEGDIDAQVDSYMFEGSKNGLRRAVEVFKGEDSFSCVYLPNIYRHRLGLIAEKM